MAIKNITPRLQPEGGEVRAGADPSEKTIVKKGSYSALETEAHALTPIVADGDAPSGKARQRWNLARLAGDLGKLTITRKLLGKSESVATAPEVLTTRYTVKNVHTTLPLYRYCGPSRGANAYAQDVALWRAESDPELFESYAYKKDNGDVVSLSEASKKLAEKFKIGIDAVMRFYPVVTRVTVYDSGNASKIPGVGSMLAHIDTPPVLDTLAASWLKIQDEIDIAADGTITRTEGWQGAESFDKNLYGNGAERWEFGTV